MSERDGVLEEFMAISGVGDEARAKFYLEAANWELSLALSGFFEGGDDQMVSRSWRMSLYIIVKVFRFVEGFAKFSATARFALSLLPYFIFIFSGGG